MRLFGPVLLGVAFGCTLVAEASAARFTRCCIEIVVPGVPPGPVCAQVRGRGRLGPRRACRLLGGRPIGRGACVLAACRPPS